MTLSADRLFLLAAVLAMAGCAGLILFGFASERSPLRRFFAGYVKRLQEAQELLLSRTSGARVAAFQIALVPAAIAALALIGVPLGVAALAVVLIGPPIVLRARVRARRKQVAAQVEGWTMLLANALKATGSLADAIAATSKLTSAPIAEEIELVLKELQLGTPLDQALHRIAARMDNVELESAVLALVVGRQTGGDVPRLLETLASTLRERERVVGVVRKELAGAKTEIAVLGLTPPFALWGVFSLLPGSKALWMETPMGQSALVFLGILWVVGLVLGWRIVRVDV